VSQTPDQLKYTAEHEWVTAPGAGDAVVRFGITDFAQEALGDIVYVSLPDPGTELTSGQTCGEVESTKSVSDVYAPVTGTVVARNPALDTNPELVNTDPYGEGWMVEVRLTDAAAVGGLLDAAGYTAITQAS
jgi:glycine cleavage system H protein